MWFSSDSEYHPVDVTDLGDITCMITLATVSETQYKTQKPEDIMSNLQDN